MNMKQNKYNYYVVLKQGNNNDWWDVENIKTNSSFKISKKERNYLNEIARECKISNPNFSLREVKRKELIKSKN